VNFLFDMKLSSDFYKVQISTNYEKIILKFVVLVLSIALARATIFALCKGNNSYKKHIILQSVQKIYYKNNFFITKHKQIELSFFMVKEGSEL